MAHRRVVRGDGAGSERKVGGGRPKKDAELKGSARARSRRRRAPRPPARFLPNWLTWAAATATKAARAKAANFMMKGGEGRWG